MITQNIRTIIGYIRHQFETSRCLGLYSWLIDFDQLLVEKRFDDCLHMVHEVKRGGYFLTTRELLAIDERECAFRLQRHGINALVALHEEIIGKLKSEQNQDENYYAETLFRLGLLYYKQNQLKKAIEYFTNCKAIKETLEETEGIGRMSRVLTALESEKKAARQVLLTLWNEYIEQGRPPIKIITDFLNDQDWSVREDSVFALGEIRAINELVAALKQHPDFKVRRDALIALEKLPGEKAIDYLVIALSDKNWFLRWYAANELGHRRSKQAEQALLNVISETDIDVRMKIIESLGKIAGQETCESLEAIIQGTEFYDTMDQSLRRKARNAVADINSRISKTKD